MKQTDVAKQLLDLNSRVEALKQTRIEAAKELELLEREYSKIVEEVKALGISDVTNLPEEIAKLEQELQSLVTQADEELRKLEEKVR